MASLVLGAVGNAVAGPIGGIVGALAGALIDRSLAGSSTAQPTISNQEGPRLTSLYVTSSAEGTPIPRVIGRQRVSPQLIWATNFREVVTVTTTTTGGGGGGGGGKGGGGGGGGGGGSPAVTTNTTSYAYFCSFALGLCEGPIQDIGQVWADGKPLDLSQYVWRHYRGDEGQGADPKIEAVEGAGTVPGFRGLAYLVFDELPLEKFGNRIPQITVEVIRRPAPTGARVEDILSGVTMIPSLGEFAYATDTVYRSDGFGHTIAENRHAAVGKSDLQVSLDQLLSAVPHIGTVALVVGWHGSDLRCGACRIEPKVEYGASKVTSPWSWQVSGLVRATAAVVSQDSFGALLGGTPSDRSVVQAIQEIKARGLRVLLYPFVMMDIPGGNTLPNPYSGNAATVGQPAFPWRGRITCSPAPGFAGSLDKSAAAASQVAAFFGAAAPGDFGAWTGDTILYSGPDEWSFRRLVLHCAKLAAAAGGVHAFLIGSEMIGLTSVRSSASTFPAVGHFKSLAADVRSILGSGTKIGYAADWTEYCSFRAADGSGDLFFHLDPLWSDANIDFVGIDNYMPVSDWRGGRLHLDAQAGAKSIYDIGYLQANIEGGELFDWYYASAADRTAQVRTPITDGYGEPWVWRYKDIRSWWSNPHHDRPGGVRSASATAWVPQSKPIWFTEFGCPAIDKGTNQPNVFYDPKSSESVFPHFSIGRRDDLIQRAYLEAIISYWDPANGRNPVGAYGHRLVDTGNLYAWTWDARPYPQFPTATLVWRDGANWRRGHWLTGRLGLATLADTVAEICSGVGVTVDTSGLNGVVRGYAMTNVMSARSALQPLMQTFFFDAVETGGLIRFVQRGGSVAATFWADDLVDAGQEGDGAGYYTITRAQETDLPRTAHLQFIDRDNDFQAADVYARRLRGSSSRTIASQPPLVLDYGEAQGVVDAQLVDAWVMRERADLTLPPSAYAIEPTDVIRLEVNGRTLEMRVEEAGFQHTRPARLVRTDAATYGTPDGPAPTRPPRPVVEPGPAVLHILDLPVLAAGETPGVPRLAAYAEPWARVAVYRSPTTSGFVLDQLIVNRSTIGKVLYDFWSGPAWRWDEANSLYVQLPSTQSLASLDDLLVLAGGNTAAIRNPDGQWEVLQFATAELIDTDRYKLSRLLRGQLGSEDAMRDPVPAGAPFVLLDATVLQSTASASDRRNPLTWKWGPSTRALDDPTVQAAPYAFPGIGLRPLSPVQLAGRRDPASGDWTLTWIRRTRIDGDSWEAPDVPLGEEVERYEVDILALTTGAVIRTATVSTPAFVYTAAMQAADFGAGQPQLRFAVYQISLAWGRGAGASKTVS